MEVSLGFILSVLSHCDQLHLRQMKMIRDGATGLWHWGRVVLFYETAPGILGHLVSLVFEH